MVGTDIGLKHLVAEIHYHELLAAAEQQRAIGIALESRSPARRHRIDGVRTALAMALLRAGSWLMPDEATGVGMRSSNRGLELRPGQ